MSIGPIHENGSRRLHGQRDQRKESSYVKSTRTSKGRLLPLLVVAMGLVSLAACTTVRGAEDAKSVQPQGGGSTTPGISSSGTHDEELHRQVVLLDQLEALVNRFDSAVTHLEQVHGEWGEGETFDLNDIRSVAEELRLRSSAPGKDAPPELQPRLDAMVERMKSISARYTVLEPKIDRLMASLKTEGEEKAP